MRFAIIGVGGYIAPKHLQAIRETGNELVAACDIHDSVGIMDGYFPDADFFTEVERFERHLEKLKREGRPIDYLSICTPNYLHDAHIRLGLRVGADVICEKPVTIKPHNLIAVSDLAKELGLKVHTIMQLRLHPQTNKIVEELDGRDTHEIEVMYTAPRGKWYDYSWKGDENKSGGLVYNLGIHFLDLLIYLFGKPIDAHRERPLKENSVGGWVNFERANAIWNLSTTSGPTRVILVDGKRYDFGAINGLHIDCYKSILQNHEMFGIDTSYEAIKLAERISNDTSNRDN